MVMYVCPLCGDFDTEGGLCKHCDIPMKPRGGRESHLREEEYYAGWEEKWFQEYAQQLLKENPNLMEVEVLADDQHLFVVTIDTVLESPEVGDSIICGRCGKKVKVFKVGVPSRTSHNVPPVDPQQSSLLGKE